jgi:flagellar biosynthesis protein FliQ
MMTPEVVMDLGHRALMLTVYLAAPLLLSALAVGLLVGIFQAATQIQEMTLSFIPKLMVLVLALVVGGPWMIRTLVEFTEQLFYEIPGLVG